MPDHSHGSGGEIAGAVEIGLQGRSYAEVMKEVEREYLRDVLSRAEGSKRKAAELAGLPYKTLCNKLANYTIKVKTLVDLV